MKRPRNNNVKAPGKAQGERSMADHANPSLAERAIPQTIGNQATLKALGIGGDAPEQEASRASDAVARRAPANVSLRVGSAIQRAPRDPAIPDAQPNAAPDTASPTDLTADAPSLLVDDDSQPGAGQMRKSEFLAEIHDAVCSTADQGLAQSGETSQGCPWIEYWLSYYGGKDAAHVEAAMGKFAPGTTGVRGAHDYVPIVVARVREGVDRYQTTGETPQMPDEMPGAGMMGGVASIFFKGREGGAHGTRDVQSVRGRLGDGAPLEGAVRRRMETAFGSDFGRVRLHTGSAASSLAAGMNARAFAVGEHVAFDAGEYKPGTPAGDALLAHELAHVVQQGAAARFSGSRPSAPVAGEALEADADHSAGSAVASIWGNRRGLAQAGPALKSGLRLQRCSDKSRRYEWQNKTLQKKIDDDLETAASVRAYYDSLSAPAKDIAKTDLERGRVDYVAFLKTLKDGDAALSTVRESVAKIDEVLDGIYRDALKNTAPGAPAPLTEYAPGTAPAALYAGTHATTPSQKTAIDKAITPSAAVDPKTGEQPKFKADKADEYEALIEQRLRDGIEWQFTKLGAGKGALHAVEANLHGWDQLEAIAEESRQEADKVFGSYTRRTAFVREVNLVDRWKQQEAVIGAASDPQKLGIAKWRVLKVFKDDRQIAAINQDYGFVSDRMPEQGIADAVIDRLANDPALLPKLLEIHKGWPGSQDPATHTVAIQRFKDADPAKNRAFDWRLFETLIHEYIHSLNHSKYTTYADSLPTGKGHTLREGMTDAFTKIVWTNVNFDEALRSKVEGPDHDPSDEFPVMALSEITVYPVTRNAEELIATVGLPNAAAAYFLGNVELIS